MKKQLLAVFFVLDFSGSMDQVLNGKLKHEVLKEGVSAFLQTTPQEETQKFLVFGTQPTRKCQDFVEKEMTSADGEKWLKSLKPGPYGMTPLAESLRRLGKKADQLKGGNVVLITDGSDTCGENPCQQLKVLNDQLARVGVKISLDVVGFDLRNNKGLDCMKDLQGKLSNINLNFHKAADSKALKKALSDSQKKGAVAQGHGTVLIDGAPADAVFNAQGSSLKKPQNWQGEFSIQLPAGTYQLQLLKVGEASVPARVLDKEVTKIPYGAFFKFRTANATVNPAGLELELTPDAVTKKVHPEAKTKTLKQSEKVPLEFGRWQVEVKGPWWLQDTVKAVVDVKARQDFQLDAAEIFKDSLSWMDASNETPRALGMGKIKILVMPGTGKVPYLKKMEVQWLSE